MLCTSPDALCDSKMVMASGPGVRGQYHRWIWTWLFSCEQDRGPCQSCPLRQPDQPKKGMSGVSEELWYFTSFNFILLINVFPRTGPVRFKLLFEVKMYHRYCFHSGEKYPLTPSNIWLLSVMQKGTIGIHSCSSESTPAMISCGHAHFTPYSRHVQLASLLFRKLVINPF